MATTELKSSIESLNNSEIKPILAQLLTEITKRGGSFSNLENRVAQLEDRMNECEKYSSKDTIIFENLPIKRMVRPIWPIRYAIFCIPIYHINRTAVTSRHATIYRPGNMTNTLPLIVKFIYLGEQMELFGRKSWLAGKRNPIIGKPIVLKKRLPARQKANKEKAESEGLIH